MTKAAQDFELFTGEDKTLNYTVTDGGGASVLMTTMSVDWVLQDEPNSGSLVKLTSSASQITMSGSVATVDLSGSLTTGCNLSGLYYSELSASDTNSNVSVLAWGWVKIHRRAY